MAARRKTDAEYTDVLTTVRIERETDRQLKATVEELDIAQSTFIRQAIKTAIAAAGVA
jgi:predicted DNA-binding protein